jgi:hypothetical protein
LPDCDDAAGNHLNYDTATNAFSCGTSGSGSGASENNAGNTGTALTINWTTALQQYATLTGNVTFTFSNPVVGAVHRLILVQDATGGRTVTWPANVKWPSSVTPTITATANAVTLCAFTYTQLGADGYLATCGTNAYAIP